MWSQAPQLLSLSGGEVHVWRAPLEQAPELQAALQERFLHSLDETERERASRFHFDKHRQRFILGRGFLRALLARYLQTAPEAVSFSYGPYGKPALSGEHYSLRFNASHSHELAVYAFAQDHEIGADVEYIKKDLAIEDIARHFFSAYEVQTLSALPEAEKAAAFFRCWTRKEAYIKAIGSGLSHPLDQFDVTFAPGEPPALLRDHRDPDAAVRWSMFNLELSDYAGALAIQNINVTSVRTFDCPMP
ncbi:MAG TPA: 4'-phosphopantetheinyl transferase superfamily protein [Pyrinomonadaceae bacterium]|jgi:4'-phosphopantetheinyl transferase